MRYEESYKFRTLKCSILFHVIPHLSFKEVFTMIKDYAKKGMKFIKDNKLMLLQAGILLAPQVASATIGGAVQTGMPWDSGLTTLQTALTGPIPKAGAVIAIAAGGALYALGDSQITKLAMRTCFGTAICCSAATVAGVFAGGQGTGSGCVFS